MKNSTIVLIAASAFAFQTACTFGFQLPAQAGIFDSIEDTVKDQIPDVGVDLDDVVEDATDNKAVSLLNVTTITFFDQEKIAEVRIKKGSEKLFYIAEGDVYDILVSIYGVKYTIGTEFLGALNGDGKDASSFISEVWLSKSDLDLFEGDFKLYLKYNLDASAYKASDEYKQKLEAEQQQAQ